MPTPEKTTVPSVLVNAEPVEVAHLDGSTSTVTMKRLSIRELYTFAEHARNKLTPAMVALCFSQAPDWVDTLTDESFGELTDKCVAVNFQRAMTLAERDPVMAMLIGPMVATGILSVAAMLQPTPPPAGAATNDSSPGPASSVSAAASGSASST